MIKPTIEELLKATEERPIHVTVVVPPSINIDDLEALRRYVDHELQRTLVYEFDLSITNPSNR